MGGASATGRWGCLGVVCQSAAPAPAALGTLPFDARVPRSRSIAAWRCVACRNGQQDDERANLGGGAVQESAEQALALVAALGRHERLTRGHAERVRARAELIGIEMGLADDELQKLRWGVLLHDIGKLSVPAEILNKESKLTNEEWAIMREHPAEGGRILEPLHEWLGEWALAAEQHHERWDGDGYPSGLRGTDISLAGRITAVADAYDVITTKRSYKEGMSAEAARRELVRCAGEQFDPVVVRAALRVGMREPHRSGLAAWLLELPTVARTLVNVPGAVATAAIVVGSSVGGVLHPDPAPEALALVEPASEAIVDPYPLPLPPSLVNNGFSEAVAAEAAPVDVLEERATSTVWAAPVVLTRPVVSRDVTATTTTTTTTTVAVASSAVPLANLGDEARVIGGPTTSTSANSADERQQGTQQAPAVASTPEGEAATNGAESTEFVPAPTVSTTSSTSTTVAPSTTTTTVTPSSTTTTTVPSAPTPFALAGSDPIVVLTGADIPPSLARGGAPSLVSTNTTFVIQEDQFGSLDAPLDVVYREAGFPGHLDANTTLDVGTTVCSWLARIEAPTDEKAAAIAAIDFGSEILGVAFRRSQFTDTAFLGLDGVEYFPIGLETFDRVEISGSTLHLDMTVGFGTIDQIRVITDCSS